MGSSDDEFVAFATARTPALLRTAWLLCGNWHLAQDLVRCARCVARRSRS
jgi:hypothetical protein